MFVRKKTVSGGTYYYLVKSERVGGRPRQKVVKYLGAIRPTKQDLEEIVKRLGDI